MSVQQPRCIERVLSPVFRGSGRVWISLLFLLLCLEPARPAELAPSTSSDRDFGSGRSSFQRGDLQGAIRAWRQLAEELEPAGNHERRAEVLLSLASVYQLLGQHRLARTTVNDALAPAQELSGRILALGKSALGSLATLTHDYDSASKLLLEALQIAQAADPSAMATVAAGVLNNLGNLSSAQADYSGAVAYYARSAELARGIRGSTLLGRALVNQAGAAIRKGDSELATQAGAAARDEIASWTPSHEQATLLLSLGHNYELMGRLAPADPRWRLQARESYLNAFAVALELNDDRSGSYAAGYLGRLYAEDSQPAEALRLFGRAIFHAQKINAPDALYRWKWGCARARAALEDRPGAIRRYRDAVDTLQAIRHDLVLGAGNVEGAGSFREEVGGLFSELADLLFQEADEESDPEKYRALLEEARRTLEQFKSAQLEDYFQDECVNIAQSKIKPIEEIAERTAIIYVIPLATRTELLVSLSRGRMIRFKVPVKESELTRTVQDFRRKLEKRTTYEYLRPAKTLHDWLIKPIEETLLSNQVDTLVFVPDGALRSVPFGALFDGKKHLIENQAVAVTPGLTLMGPKPLKDAPMEFFLGGVSERVQGFAGLDHAEEELRELKETFGGTLLLNRDFLNRNLTRSFERNAFSIVHIASHGQFSSQARDTFLLTYDGRLTLDQLERLIKPSQFRGRPVELLTLSACETASGDDRAALGLAGVALKAGARSALATLWSVNDEAASRLISQFYARIQQSSPSCSKARALQLAQLSLLHDSRYEHPAYWAPYLIIGNWL